MKKMMMMIGFSILLILPMMAKSVTIEGISKPAMMVVKDGKLYVLENTTIYIFSLKDYKLISKFGRAGEGPKEFMARPFGPPMSMSFVDGKLVVNSTNKLSYFTKEGKWISERKAFANLVLYQVKDNFVAVGPSIDAEKKFRISFRLFSHDLKELKTLYHSNISVNPQDDYILPLSALTGNPSYKGKVFVVASNEDFVIDIFDAKGTKIRRIEKKEKKRVFTAKDQADALDWFKNRSQFKNFFTQIKNNIKFKKHFPAIRDIQPADDKIHVLTYKRKGELWEMIVLDMKGKELKRLFVPLDEYLPFSYYAILYSIENGKVYSLVEDPDEEVWNLKITSI